MKILTAPHPMLKTVCRSDFIISLTEINEMFEVMRASNGIGLAAPQVGIDARVFVTFWNQVFVNPVITEKSAETVTHLEGCLSLPGELHEVTRHRRIRLGSGEVFDGLKAIVIQHECAHLDGILINK